ncbi:MAG: phage tail protein [Trueperaceae bacterium]|nr:phage tail protein [Trueperaceae bacterium]
MADETKLLDFLPPAWREHQLAQDLAQAAGTPFDYWRGLLTTVRSHLDPSAAPSEWLDWLMKLVGHFQRPGLSDTRKRNLIRGAGTIWLNKGLAVGIEAYVQAIAGVSATVTESTADPFVCGISTAGDVCGPGGAGWTYEISVPTGSIAEAELRELLEPIVPAYCVYTVTFT